MRNTRKTYSKGRNLLSKSSITKRFLPTEKIVLILFASLLQLSEINSQNYQWFKQLTDNINTQALPHFGLQTPKFILYDAVTDLKNNIYSVGIAMKNINAPDGALILTKQNPNGVYEWEKIFGIPNPNNKFGEGVYSIELVTPDILHIVGEINNTATIWVVKTNGDLIRNVPINSIGGNSRIIEIHRGVGSNGYSPKGYSYVVGYFSGKIEFKSISSPATLKSFTSFGEYDIFIAKYLHSGQLIKATQIGGISGQYAFDLDVDTKDNIFISMGSSNNELISDTGFSQNHISSPLTNFNIIKLNKSLNIEYCKMIGNGSYPAAIKIPDFFDDLGDNTADKTKHQIFRIELNENADKIYFILNDARIGTNNYHKEVIGSLDLNLLNSIEIHDVNQTSGNFDLHDIKLGECDSIYVSANIINQAHPQGPYFYSSRSSLLHFDNSNFNLLNEIKTFSAGTSHNLCRDLKGNIILTGFYSELYLFFDDQNLDYLENNFGTNGFIAKYYPCGNGIEKATMILGPELICQTELPIIWNINYPDDAENCKFYINPLDDGVPSPEGVISFTPPNNNSNIFTITSLNGYNYPFTISTKCEKICCGTYFDEIVLNPSQIIHPNITDLILNEENQIISLHAKAQLILGNLVYMWQLFEGEINNSSLNPEIVIKGEGTIDEVLIQEEFDELNNGSNDLEFIVNGLENKPYVIKLGMYYQDENQQTCGWFETRKGFLIQ